jgi:uncharacterized phage protein (TIGR02218 family)
MRPCTPALKAYLANPANLAAAIVDLYTFDLVGSPTLFYTSWTSPLAVPSSSFPAGSLLTVFPVSFFAAGPKFGPTKATVKIGIEPAELDIEVYPSINDLVGQTPFAEAVRIGLFDGATIELDRLFAPPPIGDHIDTGALGCLIWFYGRVADCDVGRSKVMIKVKSMMNLLQIQQMPRRMFMSSCSHVFGDVGCGYNRVTGTAANGTSTGIGLVNITALSSSGGGAVATSFSPSPATVYNDGTIVCLTGANAGQTRTISSIQPGFVYLIKPWLSLVTAGDTFYILPGCDHTTATCNGTFQNLARFGGMPYIPPPEFAL